MFWILVGGVIVGVIAFAVGLTVWRVGGAVIRSEDASLVARADEAYAEDPVGTPLHEVKRKLGL